MMDIIFFLFHFFLQLLMMTLCVLSYFSNDFAWTGMTNTLDGYKWQGCEPYNFSTFVHFKDSGSIPFESNRQCYKTKKDLDFALEQKECTENNGAICEQHIEGTYINCYV